jgi:PAS domain S-box-containing protein
MQIHDPAIADLRRTVHERTAALTKANESLYMEILGHRRTDLARRRAEDNYQGLFENAVVGIFQSLPDGQYLSVNPALARMYGYKSPEHLLSSVKDIANDIYVDPSVRADFERRIKQDGEVRGMEYQVRRLDGRLIWISEHARAVRNRRGRVLRYEGIVQDVTARREAEAGKQELEARLRQAQKLEAIGTLAGGIAHDFNNILGVIVGFSELVADDLPSDDMARQNLSDILLACQRAKELVQQILVFSRQAGSPQSAIRVRPIVAEVLRLVAGTLPGNVRLASRLAAEQDWAVANPVQIHQVLMNLCGNAVHAMRGKGGVLSIGLEDYAAGSDADGPVLPVGPCYLRLTVEDTGVGMEPQVLERIFEPFFTTKPAGEGTGLGLAVVHGIVKAHAGEITVRSQPGKGTAFAIYLPTCPAS